MFALFRRGRKRAQVVPEVVKEPVSSAKYVAGGFILFFFGSLAIFLELFGKCGCFGDIAGYIMVSVGSATLIFQCVKDLLSELKIEDEFENGDAATEETDEGTASETGGDLFKPVLKTRFLEPENEKVELKAHENIKVISIPTKLPPIMSKIQSAYNLPEIVIDT